MNSIQQAARVAGIGYLVIFISGIFANFVVLEGMLVPGDAAATVTRIREGDFLFRSGILGFVVMVVFDVVVTWALYLVFRPVHRNQSLFAAWFRLVNCAVFAVALYHLFMVMHLTGGEGYLQAIDPAALEAQVMLQLKAFNFTWLVGLIFFGIHLLVLGGLILQAGYVPNLLGYLLIVAAFGYLIDSFANFLLGNYADYQAVFMLIVAVPGVVAELSFCLWLIIRAGKLPDLQA